MDVEIKSLESLVLIFSKHFFRTAKRRTNIVLISTYMCFKYQVLRWIDVDDAESRSINMEAATARVRIKYNRGSGYL